MRVLYVDDDRINVLLFEQTCRLAADLHVEVALSGAEALEVVGRWQPQVLVIDRHLSDGDGCELLPRLRSSLDAPALPAFLCMADHRDDAVPVARAAGFTGCWPKPVELGALLRDLDILREAAAPQESTR